MDDWLEAAYEDRQSGDGGDFLDFCGRMSSVMPLPNDPEYLHDLVAPHGFDCAVYGEYLICDCGEQLELDAEECTCGKKNPLVAGGYI
jgi:hypothetical protein